MGTKIYTNGKWIDLIGRATRNQYAYKQLYLDTNFIWDMPNVTGVDPLDRKICYFTGTPQRSIDGTGAIIPLLTATEFDTQGVSSIVINIANISSLSTYLEGLYARVVLNGTVSPIYTLSSKLIALGGEEISDSEITIPITQPPIDQLDLQLWCIGSESTIMEYSTAMIDCVVYLVK